MGKEIERKFLISSTIPFHLGEPKLIKQAYIFAEKGKHLRIRISNGEAELGLKYTDGTVREEFEYGISLEDAMFMYLTSNLKVEKIRFNFKHLELNYDMDLFPNGIKYVEVEFPDEASSKNFKKPDWLGEEISGKSEYSNIAFAKEKLSFNNG